MLPSLPCESTSNTLSVFAGSPKISCATLAASGLPRGFDLLIPALLSASCAALVTLTKVDDLLLSFPVRSRDGRPCLVLDPFGLATGLPELVWDPIAGCVDPMVAERRAEAFTAGTIKAALGGGYGDDAARFYAAEAAKVIQAFFHAAGLTGRSLDDVLRWVANPTSAGQPTEILLQHPYAAQVGQVWVTRRTWQTGAMPGRTVSGDDMAILRPEEIRQLPERQALVLADNGKPIIARLARCIDGKAGRRLVARQYQLRARLAERSPWVPTPEARATAALTEARHYGTAADQESHL
jgi:hypothetical protein